MCFMMLYNATGQLVRVDSTIGCGIMRRQCWGQLAEGTLGIETALQDKDYVDAHELEAGFPPTIGIHHWHGLPRTGKTRSMPDTSPVRTCSVLHRCNGHGEAGHGRAATPTLMSATRARIPWQSPSSCPRHARQQTCKQAQTAERQLGAYYCPVQRMPEYWPELVIPVSEKAPVPITTSAKNRKGAARLRLYDDDIRSGTGSQVMESAGSWQGLPCTARLKLDGGCCLGLLMAYLRRPWWAGTRLT